MLQKFKLKIYLKEWSQYSLNQHERFVLRIRDVLTEPEEILALYASEKQQEKGETVMLKEIICQGQNVFIVVDTTWSVYKTDHH